jgi:hypothetical protein
MRLPMPARPSTVSESTGRASVFPGAVSGGLIALGLVATAAKTGAAFYLFGLVRLPTLAFVGLATFRRALQSGIEDLRYARRIAQLRGYYFDHATELAGYLVNPAEPLPDPGGGIRPWQQFVTLAGMVAVITAILAGSAAGLLAAVVSGHSLVAAPAVGVVVAGVALTGLMRYRIRPGSGAARHHRSPTQKDGHAETRPLRPGRTSGRYATPTNFVRGTQATPGRGQMDSVRRRQVGGQQDVSHVENTGA